MPTITIPAERPVKLVGSRGPWDARIAVVGESPGVIEEQQGQPFVGPAGNLLDECLRAAGIDPSRVFFTNLSKRRPPGNELRAFFTPDGLPNATLLGDMQLLKDELTRLRPHVVIALGNYPLKFLTGKGTWSSDGYTGIGNYRGVVLPGAGLAPGTKVVATYHPAAVLRQYPWKPLVTLDLARAADESRDATIRHPRRGTVIDPRGLDADAWRQWLTGAPGPLSPPVNFGTLEDPQWDRLPSSPFLTADIEYIGSKLLCVGFTRHADVGVTFRTSDAASIDFVRSILLSGVPLCFQNGMFDCSILEWFYDIPCFRYIRHDTFVAMHACYPEFPRDLGFIGSLYTNEGMWYEGIDAAYWKRIRKMLEAGDLAGAEAALAEMLPYNAGDVRVTHRAMEALLTDELTDPAFARTYRHEMSLIRPLWAIGHRGVPIDVEQLATLQSTLTHESDVILNGIAHLNNGVFVNVKSPPQVAKFIYDVLCLPQIGPKTPTGRWKMDDSTLASLLLKARNDRQRNGIRLVREARERLDLISKFCEIELDDDRRMRCHYDPAKTLTGRLASRKFYPTGRGSNLQNVPKDTRVRAVFVPDRGYLFGYADLKSAESLVVAHITGDAEMLRLHSAEYMDGTRDGHKYVASQLLGKPIELITKDERYLGKRVRHAGNYAMNWFKLMQLVNGDAQKTGVSIDAARAKVLINRYRQLHPGLVAWWRDVEHLLRTTHTLYTRHGRKRVFYDRPDNILPEGIAFDPQGTVADTLNIGLNRASLEAHAFFAQWGWADAWEMELYARFFEHARELDALGFQMFLQVHDAIGFQVPEASDIPRAIRLLNECMSVAVPIRRRGIAPYEITIPVDVQLGYNWGEYDEKKNPSGLKPFNLAANL